MKGPPVKTCTYHGPCDRLRTDHDKVPYLYRGVPADLPNDVASRLEKRGRVKVAKSKSSTTDNTPPNGGNEGGVS